MRHWHKLSRKSEGSKPYTFLLPYSCLGNLSPIKWGLEPRGLGEVYPYCIGLNYFVTLYKQTYNMLII